MAGTRDHRRTLKVPREGGAPGHLVAGGRRHDFVTTVTAPSPICNFPRDAVAA
jgi:hypothetical protein